jgi:Domain of unknown function (DUF1707)
MGGTQATEDVMASTGDIRVGDAEREAVAAELREHYAQGRLTLEDFQRRLDASLTATTRRDLDELISDLPHTMPAGKPLPAAGSGPWHQHGRGSGYGYGGRRRRAAFGRVSSLLAALASLLIVLDFMAGLRFPLPGRLGLLLAIFGIIRGMLRRIFGLRRR